ncbi:hypothetical protein H1S01_09690 [Heliobacterium chlorum]|uniref:Uncharacterized protein n=1 Tax=Heliobacterium chlorum TaxID=2698 RepID=A0ABR7T3J2_HELCL|nr:hypothetical protein [Heliobacterium chlorum]MBC9784782.1 hypothetical protein [Heliobacterium chlorum]
MSVNNDLDVSTSLAEAEEIRQAMLGAVRDSRLTCSQARAIAEQFSVPYHLVGRLANELKIKIRHCELGCF